MKFEKGKYYQHCIKDYKVYVCYETHDTLFGNSFVAQVRVTDTVDGYAYIVIPDEYTDTINDYCVEISKEQFMDGDTKLKGNDVKE